VLVDQLGSYRHGQTHLHHHDFTYGQFGENLTVDGLPDYRRSTLPTGRHTSCDRTELRER
jgi:MOSC domain-containing protein YiiM